MQPFSRFVALVSCGVLGCSSMDVVDGPNGSQDPHATPGGTEPARLAGITDAHNAVRASIGEDLGDLKWSADIADVAQSYAEELSASCDLVHSKSPYGENLAFFGGQQASPRQVVELWAEEAECWTFGEFMSTDRCSDACGACGHYTQIVWRDTRLVGCGVADCQGGGQREVWVCNYDPPGNFVGREPY